MQWVMLIAGAGAAYYFLIHKRGAVSEAYPTPDVKPPGAMMASNDVYGNEVVTTVDAPWRQATYPFNISPAWAKTYQWKNVGSKTTPSWKLVNLQTGQDIPVFQWNDIMDKIGG